MAEKEGFAVGCRQQAGEHLHRGGLAAAVGAEEPEDFAALDAEADMVDGDEVSEAPGEAARFDRRCAAMVAPRRNGQTVMVAPLVSRQQSDEGVLEGLRVGAG